MALSWAAINCLLEADVLTATEKIKGAEWGGWVRRVKDECSDHSPGACQPQPISLRPAGDCESGVKLLKRADEYEIDGVTGQPVAGDRIARDTFVLEDFKAHPNNAWKDNVCRNSISGGQSQKPRQPAISKFKDHKNNKPDAENAQPKDEYALQKALQQSHDPAIVAVVTTFRRRLPYRVS